MKQGYSSYGPFIASAVTGLLKGYARLRAVLLWVFMLLSFSVFSQEQVYWRSAAPNGDWDYGGNCSNTSTGGNWYYTSGGDRIRPDCGALANVIHFDNNNQTTMNLNGADYSVNQILFTPGTGSRTINTDATRSLYFWQNGTNDATIENNVSTTTHTFNVNVHIQGITTWMQIRVNDGDLIFNKIIENNSGNTLNLRGNNNRQIIFNDYMTSTLGAPGVNVRGETSVTVVYGGTPNSKTYSGPTTIYTGGTLQISSNQTLGAITLNTGGTLVVDPGVTLTITGAWTGGGTIINNGTIILAGAASQSFPGIATTVSAMNNLSINNAAGVTLDKALTLGAAGIFTLTNGILITTAANLLTISNTATTAISGGSTTSFVSGPICRNLPGSLGAGTTYIFPVGKGGTYYPMSVVDPTTGAAATLTAEAFTGPSGGTSGIPAGIMSATEYWSLTSTGGLTNHKVSLTRQTPVSAFNWIGRSTTQAGVYSYYGGTPSGSSILNSNNTGAGPSQFFSMVNGGPINVAGAVGGNGDYVTLQLAFAAINATVQTGSNIIVTVNGSTIETGTALLNAGAWNTITMYPTATGYSITGNLAAPLIDLSGADNVTIDGRVYQSGAANLIISNTSASAAAGTSTIRFINGATSNNIQYCILKGSTAYSASGLLFFSTGTTGNSGNTVDHCNITNEGGIRPYNTIYSSGSAGIANSSNTISNNNIYDIFNVGMSSSAICLSSNASAWNITGNSFYETTSFQATSTFQYYVVFIVNTGLNYNITGNFIGGSASGCSGNWVKPSTGGGRNLFNAIYLNVGIGTALQASSVQNNTIQNIDWTNNGSADWNGIYVANGNINIGTIAGNTIGNTTGTGSIKLTSFAGNSTFYGINYVSAGFGDIQNNSLGSITTNSSGNFACNINGIFKAAVGGNITIRNNLIGSLLTASSINASYSAPANAQSVSGINCTGSGSNIIDGNIIANMTNATTNSTGATLGLISGITATNGINTITGNTIRGLSISNANNNQLNTPSVSGITQNSTQAGQIVTGNTIFNLSNIGNTATAVCVTGLYYNGGAGGTVAKNFIYGLTIPNTTSNLPVVRGIRTLAGTTTYSNNIISIGSGTPGQVLGFVDGGGTNSIYHNTVSITGTASTSINASSAGLNTTATNSRNIQNNIFANVRTLGTGTHRAILISSITGLTINYNDYIGAFVGGGANSITIPPAFPNATGTLLTDYIPGATTLNGTNTLLGTITDDIDATIRCVPTMGAQEYRLSPAPPIISGDPSPCLGSSQVYSVTNVPGTTYAWTFPSGWTGGGITNSVTVTVGAGSGNITVIATNGCGTTSGIPFPVIVGDVTPPTAICKDITVYLNASGTASITGADVNNGSTDNCGAVTLAVSPNTFTCANVSTPPGFTDLIISEYVLGNGNNKYIEIYNGTASPVDLSNYQLQYFASTSGVYTYAATLSGILAPGLTKVYTNSTASIYSGPTSVLTNVIQFNGDDAMVLYKISTSSYVDIFGKFGNDPGTAWILGGNTTLDKTLRRKPTVFAGITINPPGTGPTAFATLASEWDMFDIDNVSGLGYHTVTGIGTQVTLTVKDAANNQSTCLANVTVLDSIPPVANCKNYTAQLDASGNATITGSDINNGSSDNCGFTLAVSPSSFTCDQLVTPNTPDLIISEYVEGSSFNKYIEIFNGTGASVDLSNYQLRLYSNGAATPSVTTPLSTVLLNGQTIVYKNSGATIYAGTSTTNASVDFSGDDAVVLYKISPAGFVDIFGRIGEDPGAAWTSGLFTTVDKTLVRKFTVLTGITTNPAAGFPTLSTEWVQFIQDDVTPHLGSHTMGYGGSIPVTLTVTDNNGNVSTCSSTVTLEDKIAPVITCPATPATVCISGTTYTHSGILWDATATDNCSGIPTFTYVLTGATTGSGATTLGGAVFNIGTTTITWTATDEKGNFSSCSFTVNVSGLPVVSAPAAVCVGGTITLFPVTGGTWVSNNTSFATVTNAGVVTGVAPGIVNFTFTETATGCSNTTSNVTVNAVPTATISYSGTPFCHSNSTAQPVTLSGTGAYSGGTYAATPAGLSINATTGAITPSTSAVNTYTVTYTIPASGGCASVPVTTTITILPQPIVTNSSIETACSGMPKSIVLTSDIPSTFTWLTFGNITGGITGAAGGTGNPLTQTLFNPSPSSNGSVDFYVIPTSAAGCAGSPFTLQIIVEPAPVVTQITSPPAYCNGSVVPAINFVSSVVGSTFNWTCSPDIGFGTSGTGNIPAFNALNVTGSQVPATITVTANHSGCVGPQMQFIITVNPTPDASISADYCTTPGYIILTALPPGLSYLWSTGATTQTITVDVAAVYSVTVTNSLYPACTSIVTLAVATELVTDGSFTNFVPLPAIPSFVSLYNQHQGYYSGGATGLQPEGRYAVNTSAWSNYPGVPDGYHPNFHGRDHTNNSTGARNFMMVNGSVSASQTIWQQTVTVVPGNDYYFSAWGMNLNPASPAQLRFEVNGVQVGSIANLDIAPKPTGEAQVALSNWRRFYSTPFWHADPGVTSAIIKIINLNTIAGGNDFGLDDISFGTLSFAPTVVTPTATGDGGGPICENGTLNLTANVTGGIAPFTYLWTGPATAVGFPTNQQNPSIPNVTSAYNGTYTLTVTDGYGCAPIVKTINVTVTPTVGIPVFVLGAASTRCQGAGTVTYTASATNTTGITYTLDAASLLAGNTIVAATGVVTYMAGWSGTSVITASAAGCSGPKTADHTVTITPTVGTPVFALGPVSSRCQGAGTVTYTATASNSSGITYTLDAASLLAGNTIVATTGVVTYVATWSGTTIITATAAGCNSSAPATHTVTINPLSVAPSSASVNPASYCANSIPAEIILSVTGGSGSTLNWYAGSCFSTVIGTGNNFHLLTPPAVTTMYYASWANAFGCGSSACDSVKVTVLPAPVAPISAAASNGNYCSSSPPATITLTATGGSGTTLVWYTGGCGTTLLGTGTPYIVNPAPTTTTVYYARWESGCGNSICVTDTVKVVEPALFNVTGGGGFCAPGPSDVHVFLSGSEKNVNYQLYHGAVIVGGPVAGTNLPLDFGVQPAFFNYNVIATMTVAPFCTRPMSGSVNIQSIPQPTGFNVTGGGAYCVGGTGAIINLSGSQANYSYELYLNGVATGVIINRLVAGAFSFPPQTAIGTYTVVATRNASPNCSATMNGSAIISLAPALVAGAHNTTPLTECQGFNPAILNINSPSTSGGIGPYSYDWQINGVSVGAPSVSTYDPPALLAAGIYHYTCIVTDACGTSFTTAEKVITIVADPTVTITGAGTVCQNDPVTLTAIPSGGTGTFTYQWQSGPAAAGPFTPIIGANALTYSPSTAAVGTIYYRFIYVATGLGCNNATSAPVAVIVNPIPTTSAIYHF